MIGNISAFFLAGFWGLSSLWAQTQGSEITYKGKGSRARLECPNITQGDSLLTFRSAVVSRIVRGEYDIAAEAFSRCFPSEVPACLKAAKIHNDTKRYQSSIPQYNTDPAHLVEGLTLSSEKELPPEFLVKDSAGKVKSGLVAIPPNILELSKSKGWKAVAYKTRSTGGFDAGPNLVLVAIPGADKDIYLQISPRPEANFHDLVNEPYPQPGTNLSQGQDTLTIITVDKRANPPVGQLRRMHFDTVREGYTWDNNTRVEGCLGCHASPLRSISPRGYLVTHGNEKRMKPEDERTVTEINQMMTVEGLTWGKLKVQGVETNRGPEADSHPLGWAPPNSETRTDEFIRQCAQSLTVRDYVAISRDYAHQFRMSPDLKLNTAKIRAAMDCVQCHSGRIRGPLHEGFSQDEVFFKIAVDKTMHPGSDLSPDERMALYNCLKAERLVVRDAWRTSGEWMTRSVCEDATGSTRRRNRPGTGERAPVKPADASRGTH